MIIDELNKSMAKMVDLNNKSLSSDEANKKEADNKQFNDAVITLYVNTLKLDESKKELNFKPQSRETINKFLDIADELNEVIANGEVDPELIKSAYRHSNEGTQDLKKEWDFYYKRKDTKICGELDVVSGLVGDEIEIGKIKESIYKAKDWEGLSIQENGETRLKLFSDAINKIEETRTNLKLSPVVESFLKAVSENRADVDNLSNEVLKWIKDNKMGNKFAIEFRGE